LECDWQEVAERGKYIPQLNFAIPLAYNCNCYRYDIPFGTIERQELDMDVPGNSWMVGVPVQAEDSALMLITGSKYGFRGFNNTMSLSLIRSSYDPDPYPENGIHRFKFAIAVVKANSNRELIERAYHFNHPISFISGTSHNGSLPCKHSFIALLEGSVAISAIKLPEKDASGRKLIIRLYETDGNDTTVKLQFATKIVSIDFVDFNENILENCMINALIQENILEFDLKPSCVENILVEL
jgi:alpha-mannosidase